MNINKRITTILLWPLGLLYGCIMTLRNWLYDLGMLQSKKYTLPIVSVGNLSTGGTGKTPHISYILNLFKENTAVVSRGYGRATKGVLEVSTDMSAADSGDEPLMLKKAYPKVPIILGESRSAAIDFLLNKHPEVKTILLDDAFQHRSVSPSVNILLTEYDKLFTEDYVLPAGNLREFRSGANRADAVVVSKCPNDLTEDDQQYLTKRVQLYTSAQVFFSTFQYRDLEAANKQEATIADNQPVVLLTGIANSQPMVEYIAATRQIVKHFRFPDHHFFLESELKGVFDFCGKMQLPVITTAKDLMRLHLPHLESVTRKMNLYTLPIQVKFLETKNGFDHWLLTEVKPR